jgi:hypothetical protein
MTQIYRIVFHSGLTEYFAAICVVAFQRTRAL